MCLCQEFEFENETFLTLFTGVRVMSWSKNCPNCMSMRVYLPWRWETSAWTTMETRRGLGRGFPPTPRKRGREMAAGQRDKHLSFPVHN